MQQERRTCRRNICSTIHGTNCSTLLNFVFIPVKTYCQRRKFWRTIMQGCLSFLKLFRTRSSQKTRAVSENLENFCYYQMQSPFWSFFIWEQTLTMRLKLVIWKVMCLLNFIKNIYIFIYIQYIQYTMYI